MVLQSQLNLVSWVLLSLNFPSSCWPKWSEEATARINNQTRQWNSRYHSDIVSLYKGRPGLGQAGQLLSLFTLQLETGTVSLGFQVSLMVYTLVLHITSLVLLLVLFCSLFVLFC